MARPTVTAKRVTASLREPDAKNLEAVAESAQLSPNDAIRKALATEAFVQRVLADGGKIMVKDENGQLREVAFVN